ncbi:MAG: hypothetical protein NVS3B26_25450 [Mycobacteriales bacterium]
MPVAALDPGGLLDAGGLSAVLEAALLGAALLGAALLGAALLGAALLGAARRCEAELPEGRRRVRDAEKGHRPVDELAADNSGGGLRLGLHC